MAHDISDAYARTLSLPNLAHLHALVALRSPLRRLRKLLQRLDAPKSSPAAADVPPISAMLEAAAAHYQEHGWAFVKDVFTDAFHTELVRQFPERRYLDPPPSIYKAYDIGFKWQVGRKEPRITSRHAVYQTLFSYLRSDEFTRRITAFTKAAHPISCRSFLVNKTYPGSLVIPHKDDPVPANYLPYLNMVFFIDGTGGTDSGELILARDNEYKDIVFTPPTLRNACLIYDTEAPLYHGFKPVAWGKRRIAATASFVCTDYVEEAPGTSRPERPLV